MEDPNYPNRTKAVIKFGSGSKTQTECQIQRTYVSGLNKNIYIY